MRSTVPSSIAIVVFVAVSQTSCAKDADWQQRADFCSAAKRLSVDVGLPDRNERLQAVEEMRDTAPRRWEDLMSASLEVVESRGQLDKRFERDFVLFTDFVEKECDINVFAVR